MYVDSTSFGQHNILKNRVGHYLKYKKVRNFVQDKTLHLMDLAFNIIILIYNIINYIL